jgi:predicted protein tyrosine phosphatase
MLIKSLGRHLAVASAREAQKLVMTDRGFWNVISIREVNALRIDLPGAKRVHYVAFDDAENASEDGAWVLARETDVGRLFAFADAHPAEPLLVHCRAGVSRSTAVALGFIVRGLLKSERLIEDAVEQLLAIRPGARPNVHVLGLSLRQFLPADQADPLTIALVNHPVLLNNRFQNPRGI